MAEKEYMKGQQARLKEPYRGYSNIRLIEYWPTEYKWEVEIISSGKKLMVYEDEFELDL